MNTAVKLSVQSGSQFAELKALLAPPLSAALQTLPGQVWQSMQEIRLRVGQPVRLCLAEGERTLPRLC